VNLLIRKSNVRRDVPTSLPGRASSPNLADHLFACFGLAVPLAVGHRAGGETVSEVLSLSSPEKVGGRIVLGVVVTVANDVLQLPVNDLRRRQECQGDDLVNADASLLVGAAESDVQVVGIGPAAP
jgi:hypothetical protein